MSISDEFYTTPKSNAIMRFLWRAAGADRFLLERATYGDQVKYLCLGGIVLATGGMAGLAGGYAFYTIFSPKGEDALDALRTIAPNPDYHPTHAPTAVLSIVFGIIWGLIIFNIDRFIVTSTGKGDGTEAITWKEFKGAIPRIVMGMIIAITISKPMEIRIFQSEIDNALQQYQDSVMEVKNAKAQGEFAENTKLYSADLHKINGEIETKQQRIVFLDSMITFENTHGGCHDKCNENKNQRVVMMNEIADLKRSPEYIEYSQKITSERNRLDDKIHTNLLGKTALNGLLIRIQLAQTVSGPLISTFITLLFMAIELTPIFFKLMLVKTPYDYLAENRDELIKASKGIEVQYDLYKDKAGLERHLVINHEPNQMINEKKRLTEVQGELTEYALEKYREREKKRIDENLDEYVKQ